MQILGAFLGGNVVNDQLSKISRMIVCQSLYPEDDSVLKSLPRALWIQFLWWIMIQVFSDCVVPENIHTSTTEDSLICTLPNPQDFSFQGVFDDPPPLPPGISRSFKRGLRLPFFRNSKWFWYFKTKKVNTNSVSYKNMVESYYNSAV